MTLSPLQLNLDTQTLDTLSTQDRELIDSRCNSKIIESLYTKGHLNAAHITDPKSSICELAISRYAYRNVCALYDAGKFSGAYLCNAPEGTFDKIRRIVVNEKYFGLIMADIFTVEVLLNKKPSEISKLREKIFDPNIYHLLTHHPISAKRIDEYSFRKLTLVSQIIKNPYYEALQIHTNAQHEAIYEKNENALKTLANQLKLIEAITQHPKWTCLVNRGKLNLEWILEQDITALERIKHRLDLPSITQQLTRNVVTFEDLRGDEEEFKAKYNYKRHFKQRQSAPTYPTLLENCELYSSGILPTTTSCDAPPSPRPSSFGETPKKRTYMEALMTTISTTSDTLYRTTPLSPRENLSKQFSAPSGKGF